MQNDSLPSLSRVTRQSGAVLLICLVFMLLMVVISVHALRATTLQERMAGNARDTHVAFQAAEAALRAAERRIETGVAMPFSSNQNGFYETCTSAEGSCPDYHNSAATGWISVGSFGGGVNGDPQYYIEELNDNAVKSPSLDSDQEEVTFTLYRITARGFGISDSSVVVLRSVYRRQD